MCKLKNVMRDVKNRRSLVVFVPRTDWTSKRLPVESVQRELMQGSKRVGMIMSSPEEMLTGITVTDSQSAARDGWGLDG